MSDSLVIRQLAIPALIGVYDFERLAPQTLRVDIRLWLTERQKQACTTDALADALDYSAVAERVRTLAAGTSFYLLEALGDWLCRSLLTEFPCAGIDLTLYKDGCIPDAVGAEYHLSRRVGEVTG